LACRQQVELLVIQQSEALMRRVDELEAEVLALKTELEHARTQNTSASTQFQDEGTKVQSWLNEVKPTTVFSPSSPILRHEHSNKKVSLWNELIKSASAGTIFAKVDEILGYYWDPRVPELTKTLQGFKNEGRTLTDPQLRFLKGNEESDILRGWLNHPENKPRAIRFKALNRFFDQDTDLYFHLFKVFHRSLLSPPSQTLLDAIYASSWPNGDTTPAKSNARFKLELSSYNIQYHLIHHCHWTRQYVEVQVKPYFVRATSDSSSNSPLMAASTLNHAHITEDIDMEDAESVALTSAYNASEEKSDASTIVPRRLSRPPSVFTSSDGA
jgi:hypothetical protein